MFPHDKITRQELHSLISYWKKHQKTTMLERGKFV